VPNVTSALPLTAVKSKDSEITSIVNMDSEIVDPILPPEIWIQIFTELEWNDLLPLQRVGLISIVPLAIKTLGRSCLLFHHAHFIHPYRYVKRSKSGSPPLGYNIRSIWGLPALTMVPIHIP
jgi:hypothetical protein